MRFADPKPPFCSACYQHSTGDHIDFEASWDGPVLEDGSQIKVSVDELILCKNCVRLAAEMIGMDDPDKLRKLVGGLTTEVESLRQEVRVKDDAISDLTYTNGLLAKYPAAKKQGRPKIEGVPDETKKRLAEAARRAEGQQKRHEKEGAKA